jgi:hypothetical protein
VGEHCANVEHVAWEVMLVKKKELPATVEGEGSGK